MSNSDEDEKHCKAKGCTQNHSKHYCKLCSSKDSNHLSKNCPKQKGNSDSD